MSKIADLIQEAIVADNNGDLSDEITSHFDAEKEMTNALQDVLDERIKQDKKWGEQNHNPYIYLAILLEEIGELAQAILQTQFGGDKGGWVNVRKEAIHSAAVALALIECLDRDKWYCVVEFNYSDGSPTDIAREAMKNKPLEIPTDVLRLLRECEWGWRGARTVCPSCGWDKTHGHEMNCYLSKLIND